jgi:hypothetical protein
VSLIITQRACVCQKRRANSKAKGKIIMRMLRIFSLYGAIALSVMLSCATVQALTYDFEDAKQKDEWEDLRGETEIVDGLLCEMETADLPLISVIKDWEEGWTDYTISVKAQGSVGDADWGIVFRVQDVSNYYKWEFCNSLLRFVTEIGGARTAVFTTPQPEVLEEWQDFKVVVEGDTFELYWNGDLIQTVTHDAFKTGKVGVASWINAGLTVGEHGGAAYDDFDVEGPGIPAMSVEPEDKLATTWAGLKSRLDSRGFLFCNRADLVIKY